VMTDHYNHVPILNGSTDHETALGPMHRSRPTTQKEYRDAVLAQPNGLRSIEVFPATPGASFDELMVEESTSVFACNVLRTGNAFARSVPVYEYLFADPAPPVNGPPNAFGFKPGAYHTSDIQYVFAQRYPNSAFPGAPDFSPAQAELSRQMMADWGQFVREGRITTAGWAPLAGGGSVRILKPEAAGANAPQSSLRAEFKCDYWDTTHAIP
jgi:para-nitrobenzyl esterase